MLLVFLQSEETLKLQDFIRKKFPELNSEEIEKISNQFMELGFFLVRLNIEQHSKAIETQNTESLEQGTRESP